MSDTGAFKPVDALLEELVTDKNGLPGAIVIVLDRQGIDLAVSRLKLRKNL